MTPLEALNFMNNIARLAPVNEDTHLKRVGAFQILEAAITKPEPEKPPVKVTKKKKSKQK